MKEATGELSGTVITVVAIAAVAAIFTAILLPYFRNSIQAKMHCSEAICPSTCSSATCECVYVGDNNDEQKVRCPNPDSAQQ